MSLTLYPYKHFNDSLELSLESSQPYVDLLRLWCSGISVLTDASFQAMVWSEVPFKTNYQEKRSLTTLSPSQKNKGRK